MFVMSLRARKVHASGLHTAPVASEGLSCQPKSQRRLHQRGSLQKMVWCRRVSAGTAQRQGKCNL
eukprot:12150261-Ditylum_brightwellii.AAC.1